MGLPPASVSTIGNERSARVHMPWMTTPPVSTTTWPVPIVCASGLFRSAELGRYSTTMTMTLLVLTCPLSESMCGFSADVRR